MEDHRRPLLPLRRRAGAGVHSNVALTRLPPLHRWSPSSTPSIPNSLKLVHGLPRLSPRRFPLSFPLFDVPLPSPTPRELQPNPRPPSHGRAPRASPPHAPGCFLAARPRTLATPDQSPPCRPRAPWPRPAPLCPRAPWPCSPARGLGRGCPLLPSLTSVRCCVLPAAALPLRLRLLHCCLARVVVPLLLPYATCTATRCCCSARCAVALFTAIAV